MKGVSKYENDIVFTLDLYFHKNCHITLNEIFTNHPRHDNINLFLPSCWFTYTLIMDEQLLLYFIQTRIGRNYKEIECLVRRNLLCFINQYEKFAYNSFIYTI